MFAKLQAENIHNMFITHFLISPLFTLISLRLPFSFASKSIKDSQIDEKIANSTLFPFLSYGFLLFYAYFWKVFSGRHRKDSFKYVYLANIL